MIAFATLFVLTVFWTKNGTLLSFWENIRGKEAGQSGLEYDNEIIGDLVSRDRDADGVLDWEEALWGTDPDKKDTNGDGTLDDAEVQLLKQAAGMSTEIGESDENLTKTDQFSRELFATVTALDQNGAMDLTTIDKLSSSLAEKIKNSVPEKVFSISDLNVIQDDSIQAIKNYSAALDSINKKYPAKQTVLQILSKFTADENNVDSSVLSELTPIIDNTNKTITDMIKMSVPRSLAQIHLDILNALERSVENVRDIQLYDTDPIIALQGISQYDKNKDELQLVFSKLMDTISQKLNS